MATQKKATKRKRRAAGPSKPPAPKRPTGSHPAGAAKPDPLEDALFVLLDELDAFDAATKAMVTKRKAEREGLLNKIHGARNAHRLGPGLFDGD